MVISLAIQASTFLMTFGVVRGVWVDIVYEIGLSVLGITLGIAVLRYRLFDINVIIRRTLVYGALTALLALLFFGSVFVLQAAFSALFGNTIGGRPSEVVLVVSTLILAALALPLRNRVQAIIDRRFYRRKYDAEKVMEAFAARLQTETDEATLAADLRNVVQHTLQPKHVKVWLVDQSPHPNPLPKGEGVGS